MMSFARTARDDRAPVPRAGAMTRVVAWFAADDADPVAAGPPAPPALIRPVVAQARLHPAAADSFLAAAVTLYGAIGLVRTGRLADCVLWILMVASTMLLIGRRRYPAVVFALTFAATVVQWLYEDRALASLVLLIALYTVARHAPRRTALTAAAAVEIAVTVATLSGVWLDSFIYITGLVSAAFFLGTGLRTRQAYLAAVVERARRLEHERDQQARIAAAAERASIAREMHDIVAHSLAVIITMAEAAAAKRRSDPERAAAAMEQVAETGRQALDQTRRLLGVLRPRAPAAAPAPLPGLDQLDGLLEQVRATGLSAELSVTGQPFPVPDGGQLAIYRIVQEALTNSMRHALGATRVRIRLEYAEPVIEIDITDDGRQATGTGHHGPAGHGVAGMRERAALYGGALIAGPRPGGGWKVNAALSPAAGSVTAPAQ